MQVVSSLQVWPIADATFSGIDTVHAYEKIPTITVTLNDLYPERTTFVRVYSGEPTADPEGPSDVLTSYVIIQDSIPQNRIHPVTVERTLSFRGSVFTAD